MTVAPIERVAAAMLILEAVALACVAGAEMLALVRGDSVDPTSGIALIVLTLLGVVAVAAFGVAVARGQSWGRSGGIVTQVLIGAVALGAVTTGADTQPLFALGLGLPAVIVLVVLILAVRAAARRIEPSER